MSDTFMRFLVIICAFGVCIIGGEYVLDAFIALKSARQTGDILLGFASFVMAGIGLVFIWFGFLLWSRRHVRWLYIRPDKNN